MALPKRVRFVQARFGYDSEDHRWLLLQLYLLDAAVMAEHFIRHWLAPIILELIERELVDSDSGLTPVEEFRLLAFRIVGVHGVGKCTPVFSVQAPVLDGRMREVELIHESADPLERCKVPYTPAGRVTLESWLMDGYGWDLEPVEALAPVVGVHHDILPTTTTLTADYDGYEHLPGENKAWSVARHELLEPMT